MHLNLHAKEKYFNSYPIYCTKIEQISEGCVLSPCNDVTTVTNTFFSFGILYREIQYVI